MLDISVVSSFRRKSFNSFITNNSFVLLSAAFNSFVTLPRPIPSQRHLSSSDNRTSSRCCPSAGDHTTSKSSILYWRGSRCGRSQSLIAYGTFVERVLRKAELKPMVNLMLQKQSGIVKYSRLHKIDSTQLARLSILVSQVDIVEQKMLDE